jgi:hypothetical protein
VSPDFLEVDRHRLEVMADFLGRPAEIEQTYSSNDFAWEGVPGSQAQDERGYQGPAPADYAWHPRLVTSINALIHMGVTVLAEQALAISRLITDPTIGAHGIFGVEACARSAIENGAKAWWLIDPAIGPRTRMARYWSEQLYSARAAETLATEMGWTTPVNEMGYSASTEMVRRSCHELGLTITGKKRSPFVDGVGRSTITEMVTDVVSATVFDQSGPMVYRLLSATNHGTLYGIMRAFRPTDETHNGSRISERFADHRVIESAASVTLEVFAVLMQRIVDFMGWDHWRITSFRNMIGNLVTTGPR